MFKIGDWVRWNNAGKDSLKVGKIKNIREEKDGRIMLYLLNWTKWILANECELST